MSIASDHFIKGLRRLTDAIHAHGGKAGIQLNHAGPVAFARVVHAGGFEHVEPHAAVGALGVVGDEALADFAVDRAVVRDH